MLFLIGSGERDPRRAQDQATFDGTAREVILARRESSSLHLRILITTSTLRVP